MSDPDLVLISSRAFARIGTAYEKMGDLANAILFYQKAQTEHRTPEVLAKLRAAEKAKITKDRESYVSPELAEKARELGNAKFKESDWPAAVDAYSEMIKRAPEDPRGYSNRAACFIKLLEFPSAVQDCDEAIKRDPKFIRAYLRKAQAYFTMREYTKCIDTCTEASEHDEGGKNAREIQQQEQKALQAQYSAREGETEAQTMERIQRDPEVSQRYSTCKGNVLTKHRSPASCKTPSCRASSSKRRRTRRRCKSISRTRLSAPRCRSWCMLVSSAWGDEDSAWVRRKGMI
jgi:stress-induced-phosphoprotein 1